ncbi:hypothetical protein BH10PSE17_BH10PSE17_00720 [soil metagenome]
MAIERKQAALIAWLVTYGPTPRSRLAGLLWPGVADARARGNLRQSLSKLHQIAKVQFVLSEGPLLALADDVVVEAAPAGARWLESFSYDDCSELAAWVQAGDEARRSARRQALLVQVRAAARDGELDRALHGADELLALDRESEEAYRVLMEVFYLRGDRAAAIDVWDRCRTMVRGLYGVLPSAETQRLGQMILESDAPPVSAATALPVTVLRPPRLIGRAGQLAALVTAWQSNHAVCVSGEGGVGKSRLLGEFAATLGPTVIASARPGDAARPFASLSRLVLAAIEQFQPSLDAESIDVVVRLLPPIAAACGRGEPEPLHTPHERTLAQAELAHLLQTCIQLGCAAFVFDDLQFADRASVETLQALIERDAPVGDPLPARLALGSRDEELLPHAQALLAALSSRGRFFKTTLGALAGSEVTELMQSLGLPGFDPIRQAARLRRRVGGNPAFLLESIKLIATLGQLGNIGQELPVPRRIEEVVERRLALLEPQARRLAELASIAAESFSVELACRELNCSLGELAQPLSELERRQVLYGRQFVHDVIASAVRRNVSPSVAARLHRLVAEHVETMGGQPAAAAEHWMACEEWRRAGDSFMAAAADMRRAVRPAELALMLDAAAEAFARVDDAQALRFEALRQRLQVPSAPDYMATRSAQLERLTAEAADERQELHVLLAAVSAQADYLRSQLLEQAERGMNRAQALGLPQLAFEFAHPVAWQYAGKGQPGQGLAVIEAQRAWVFAQDDVSLRVRFHTIRSGVLGLADRVAEAVEEAEQCLALLRKGGDQLAMLPVLSNLGLMRSWRGEFDEARARLVEAAALRDRLHSRGTGLLIDVNLGAALRDLGRYREALQMLEAVIVEYRSQLASDGELTDLVIAENHLAQLWLSLGRVDLAESSIDSDASKTDIRFRLRRLTLKVRASRIRGRRDESAQSALRALIDEAPFSYISMMGELELARALPARERLAHLASFCERPMLVERPGLLMHALTLMAGAAREHGDDQEARLHVDHLLAIGEACLPVDIDPVEMWRVMHAVLQGAADAAAAAGIRRSLQRSAAWLQSVRAPGLPEDTERTHAALQPPLAR